MRRLSAVLALAVMTTMSATADAQLIERAGGILTGRTSGRVESRGDTRVDPRTGTVYGGVYGDARSDAAGVPPGHLPPRGMCRVWIEGVPPGRQPRPTDCSTAEAERYRYGANARVIYGDRTPHPGQGRAREGRSGRSWETVIDGRRCRVYENYENGVRRDVTRCDTSGRVWDREGRGDDDDDSDDDRWERDDDRRGVQARAGGKSKGKVKKARKGKGRH